MLESTLKSYNSFGGILRVKDGLCEETPVKERLISVVQVRLLSPTLALDIVTECRTLNERMIFLETCETFEMTQNMIGFVDHLLVQ